jgi:hypothetical protein
MKINSTLKTVLVYVLSSLFLFLIVRKGIPQKSILPLNALKISQIPEVDLDDLEFQNNSAHLIVEPFNGKNPITIASLDIQSKVTGPICTTTYTYVFQNNSNRQLEGSMEFPLAEGQTITRFAMDINGKMREGVCVEKEKARVAFETTTRKNIDPGLVEMTAGNNFKARVFPIPPNGTKKVLIECMEELKVYNATSIYFLPLNYKENIESLSIDITVSNQLEEPLVIFDNDSKLAFKKVNTDYKLSLNEKNILIANPITLKLPLKEKPVTINYSADNKHYFYTRLTPRKIQQEKEMPVSISVLWDASNSRLNQDKEKEIQFLEAYLKKSKSSIIELTTFSNAWIATKRFSVLNGNCKELIQAINEIQYDGGTNIADLPYAKFNGEELLIFTDGLTNLGDQFKAKSKRIYTINSAASCNEFQLRQMAEEHGGEFINLTNTPLKQALRFISTNTLHFLGFAANKELLEYFPRSKSVHSTTLNVAGICKGNGVNLFARYGFNGKVVYEEKINIQSNTSIKAAKKLWALKKVNDLQGDFKKNKALITELGLQNNLVTQNTSLLVLDRVEDYVEHEIVPPSDLRKEYDKLMANKVKSKVNKRKRHLAEVYSDFLQQVKWWNTNFNPKKKKAVEKNRETQGVDAMSAPNSQVVSLEDRIVSVEEESVSLSNGNGEPTLAYTTPVLSGNSYSWTPSEATASSSNFSSNNSVAERKSVFIVEGWDPNTPYMKQIKEKDKTKAYSNYLKIKTKYADQPSFYIDVAEYFFNQNETEIGLRVLTNIAELELENHELKRILANKLLSLKKYKLAIQMFKELVDLRGEEPQSYRDLGLAYAEIGEDQLAIETLYTLVEKPFDSRFRGIELIALNEINQIISQSKMKLDLAFMHKKFIKNMPVDIRVVLNWDADMTDVDLWVTDPKGEKCFYSNKLTAIGGRISNDFTQGYGPEEFMIKKAIPGKYKIEANYYGTSKQSIQGKATLSVDFYTNYGKGNVKKQISISRLNATKEVVQLGEFFFK